MSNFSISLAFLFLLSLCTPRAFADGNLNSKISAIQDKEQAMIGLAIKSAKEDISRQAAYKNFTCAGIGMIDHGIAIDRDAIFFKADTREFICTFGMVYCFSADAKSCTQPCPPPEWEKSGCWEKRKELLEKQNQELQEYLKRSYDKK